MSMHSESRKGRWLDTMDWWEMRALRKAFWVGKARGGRGRSVMVKSYDA